MVTSKKNNVIDFCVLPPLPKALVLENNIIDTLSSLDQESEIKNSDLMLQDTFRHGLMCIRVLYIPAYAHIINDKSIL